MKSEFTKLGTFAAAELDTERNITGTIMNNVISAEECYVVRNAFEEITTFELGQKLDELWEKDLDELWEKDFAKDDELRKKGITPNHLTQGTWEICFVKVGYEHNEQLDGYYQ